MSKAKQYPESGKPTPMVFTLGLTLETIVIFLIYKIIHMAYCALFTVTETIWFQVHWKTTHLFEIPHPETAKVPSTIQSSLGL